VSNGKRIRAAVVGCGHMGRYHVAAYSELHTVDVVGVCDVDRARAEQAAAPFGYSACTDYRELFDHIDVVTIAAPTELHHPIAKDFIEHGVHVLLEKPIAPTLAEAEDLFAAAARRKVALHIGHVERFNGAIQEVKKIIDRPVLVESRRVGPWTGRSVETGVVMDLMIHDIDIVMNLVDRPVRELQVLGRKVRSDFEDLVIVQMDFDGGAMATLVASRVTEEKMRTLAVHQPDAFVLLDYASQDVQIHRRASSSAQLSADQLRYRQESIVERVFVHKGNPLKFEIQHFLQHAMGDGDRMVSVEQELRSFKIALQVLAQVRGV
jgi:predicted dehydrogenase